MQKYISCKDLSHQGKKSRSSLKRRLHKDNFEYRRCYKANNTIAWGVISNVYDKWTIIIIIIEEVWHGDSDGVGFVRSLNDHPWLLSIPGMIHVLWYDRNYYFVLLPYPWTSGRSNQPILKEINSEFSLEGLLMKLKLQYFGHLMWIADLLEKTLMLWKMEGKRRIGWQRMRWLDSITDSVDMNFSKLWEIVETENPGMLQCMRLQRVGLDLETKQQQQQTIFWIWNEENLYVGKRWGKFSWEDKVFDWEVVW